MPTAYDEHIKFFGSPESYAAAINKREQLGESLSDPVAAAAFKAGNPQYFKVAPAVPAAPTQQQTYQTGVNDILTQLKQKVSGPQDVTASPYYQSSLKAAQQGADTASRQAMETLNTRGILNSTIAGDRVAQIQQQNMTQTIPALIEKAYKMQEGEFGNLLNMLNAYSGLENQQYSRDRQAELDKITIEDKKLAQEQKKLSDAWNRVKNLGYVDNIASISLGIPVGTSSYEAQKDVQDRQSRLDIAREQISGAMERARLSESGAMQRHLTSTPRQQELSGKDTATNQAVAEVMTYNSKEEALSELREAASDLASQGVDIDKVVQAINRRWPTTWE